MAKKPTKKAPPRPRNVAAKSLREGQFRPKITADPKAYRRHPRHPAPILPPEDGEGGND